MGGGSFGADDGGGAGGTEVGAGAGAGELFGAVLLLLVVVDVPRPGNVHGQPPMGGKRRLETSWLPELGGILGRVHQLRGGRDVVEGGKRRDGDGRDLRPKVASDATRETGTEHPSEHTKFLCCPETVTIRAVVYAGTCMRRRRP